MNRQTVVILLLILSIFSFISCSDSPSSIGTNLLSGDDIEVAVLDSFKDSLQQGSTYDKQKIALGNSSRIFLGKKNNVEASTLLKFFYLLPDSIERMLLNDSITVISAKIYLVKNYVYSKNDEALPLDFTIHKITSSWTSNTFNEDSLDLMVYDPQDMSVQKTFSDTLYTVTINNALAKLWMEESADTILIQNNGIYLKPVQTSEKIVGFDAFSSSSDSYARLETVYRIAGTEADTIFAYLLNDVSVITGERIVLDSENIAIQAGLSIFSKISFDVSSLPKHAVISKADLELTKDTLLSVFGSSFTDRLLVFFVKDSVTNELDSTVSVTLNQTDSSYKGLITSYVNRWQTGESNQGLMIVPAGLVEGLELFILKGSNAADYLKRPRLKITYNTIKQ